MLQIILAVLAISIVSFSGFAMVQQWSLQNDMQDVRENSRRLDLAARAIGGKLIWEDGKVLAPYGETVSDVVAGSVMIYQTVKGKPFRFCPIGPEAGIFNTTTNNETVLTSPDIHSSLSTSSARAQFAGIIIAGGVRGGDAPACSEAQFSGGKVVVMGGLARGIPRVGPDSLAEAAQYSSLERTVSTDAELQDALDMWFTRQPKAMTINLTSSVSYVIDEGFLERGSLPEGTERDGRLTIKGNGASILSASASGGYVAFDPHGDVTLLNVSMPNTTLTLGSHNEAIVGATIKSISIDNGSKASLLSGASILAGIGVGGELAIANASSVAISNSGGAAIDVGVTGRVSISGSYVNLDGNYYGVANTGNLRIASSSVTFSGSVSQGLAIAHGGTLTMSGGTLGAAGVAAVFADQAALVSGTGTDVAKNASNICWASASSPADFAFAYSDQIISRPNSTGSDPEYSIARSINHSSWDCI